MKTILAAPNLLKIENIALYSDEVRLVVKTRPLKSACPSCGQYSTKANSRYHRQLADLPWEGVAAKLLLSVRKFFCLNLECRQKIFCERLPRVAAPYAHKTMRLNELITSQAEDHLSTNIFYANTEVLPIVYTTITLSRNQVMSELTRRQAFKKIFSQLNA
jgi:transposase